MKMRNLNFLITAFLCLVFQAQNLQAQDLQQKITLKVEKAALVEVLQQLYQQEGLRFSFLNKELAGDTIRQFEVADRPTSEVLDKLLEQSGAGYKEHNGQLIIKKNAPIPPGKQTQEKDTLAGPATMPSTTPSSNSTNATPASASLSPDPSLIGEASGSTAASQEDDHYEKQQLATIPATPHKKGSSQVMAAEKEAQKTAKIQFQQPEVKNRTTNEAGNGDKVEDSRDKGGSRSKKKIRSASQKISGIGNNIASLFEASEADTSLNIRPFHFGLIYPLSTNGLQAPEIVNRFSLHGIVGVAAGLQGIEMSGAGNIETEFVHGLQLAGAFNIVGGPLQGGQFAGAFNIAEGSSRGRQFAGAFNINKGHLQGAQFSGAFNTVEEIKGAQFAGAFNLAGGNSIGFQAAGAFNVADSLQGSQVSGAWNQANKIDGVQISGFINKAGHIRGSQIGIINFADSMENGIPIGILSFIRNGYKALEVYTAEDFQANIAFKTGLPIFYNILALGIEMREQERWGLGYGLGSQFISGSKFQLSTDLLSYALMEESYQKFPDRVLGPHSHGRLEINQLYKLRMLASYSFGRRLTIFGGPTYNVLVAYRQKITEEPSESGLSIHNAFYNRTYNNSNVKMWFGFNLGLRF